MRRFAEVVTDAGEIPAPDGQWELEDGSCVYTVGGLVELAIDVGVIKQSGPFYSLPDEEQKIQGKLSLIEKLKTEPKLFKKIQELITK